MTAFASPLRAEQLRRSRSRPRAPAHEATPQRRADRRPWPAPAATCWARTWGGWPDLADLDLSWTRIIPSSRSPSRRRVLAGPGGAGAAGVGRRGRGRGRSRRHDDSGRRWLRARARRSPRGLGGGRRRRRLLRDQKRRARAVRCGAPLQGSATPRRPGRPSALARPPRRTRSRRHPPALSGGHGAVANGAFAPRGWMRNPAANARNDGAGPRATILARRVARPSMPRQALAQASARRACDGLPRPGVEAAVAALGASCFLRITIRVCLPISVRPS